MQLLGLTYTQTEIVKSTQTGECYDSIAQRLGMNRYDVVREDLTALAVLSSRWRMKEIDVKRKLSAMFLLVLCLVSSYHTFINNMTFTMQSVGEKGIYAATIDSGNFVFIRARTRTRTRTRTKTKTRARINNHSDSDDGESFCSVTIEPEDKPSNTFKAGEHEPILLKAA